MRSDFFAPLNSCCTIVATKLAILPRSWSLEQKAKVANWVMHTRHVIHQALAAAETKHYAHLAQIFKADAAEEVAAGAALW